MARAVESPDWEKAFPVISCQPLPEKTRWRAAEGASRTMTERPPHKGVIVDLGKPQGLSMAVVCENNANNSRTL